MDSPSHHSPNPELTELLRSWQVQASDDPALVAKVWRRIDATKKRSWPDWIDGLVLLFARPLVAFSAVALFAASGAALALVENSIKDEARFDRLVREYVRSIDPVQMVAATAETSHRHP